MEIRPFTIRDQDSVISLWFRCNLVRPWNDPAKDICRKVRYQSDLFFVALLGGRVVGSIVAGYDGHRGWINYLAVEPELRGQGIGRCLLLEAEKELLNLGCPKVNLQIRRENAAAVEFYRRLGYVEDPVVSMGKRLERNYRAAAEIQYPIADL
jgi:ribosomal protein S18 acetylase RimI-like enzyme